MTNIEQILTTGFGWVMQLAPAEFLAGPAAMAATGLLAGMALGKMRLMVRGKKG